MSVLLSPQTEEMIREKVESGRYPTADEVVQEALRLLEAHERHLARLRAELTKGIDQLDRGEGVELTEERMEQIFKRALDNSKAGKPIKDAVKP
jgi:antitoxin ParD1/3/4